MCHRDEGLALLEFKNSLAVDSSTVPSQFCEQFAKFTDQPNESITSAQEDGLIQGSLVSLENRERFNLQSNNSSSPQSSLTFLFLSSCNLSQFPGFLKAQENLVVLDLSNNKIQGELPEWLRNVGKDSLYYLNLSLNSLTGGIEHIHSWKNLRYIDLHSNKLHCQLPPLPLSTYVFSASENSLTGEIPKSICNLGNLELFDLSNNSFSGAIPQCLGYFSDWLSVLDLRSNKLHGILPTTFGRCYSLRTLELNGNNLEGHLPLSLVNCKRLEVIDLGNNKFNGTFPHWLGALPQLQVLVLRSNYFHGHVRDTISEQLFGKLRILDVSNNNFSGILPSRLLKNFKAMINLEQRQGKLQYMFDGVTTVVKQAATDQLDAYGGSFFFTRYGYGGIYYSDSITLTVKGFNLELQRILTVLTAIDVSNNKFSGDIPESIGELISVRWLNLSHNKFTGNIPPSLGNLKEL
ncbi:hypothetical protein Ancab_010842 [Ancistrocladus abbreviatus]